MPKSDLGKEFILAWGSRGVRAHHGGEAPSKCQSGSWSRKLRAHSLNHKQEAETESWNR